jgi:hypothetical protein
MGSRGQRPAPLEISSGLADFLSADGGEGEGGKKKTTTTFLFFFSFYFFHIFSLLFLVRFYSREKVAPDIDDNTRPGKGKEKEEEKKETRDGRNDKKSAKGGKCKSTCRHNLRESICLYRVPHLLIMERQIEMGFLSPFLFERGKKPPPPGCLI